MPLPEGIARAEGAQGFIVIVIIYAILTVAGKIKQAAKRNEPPPRPGPRPARAVAPPRMASPEARRLEELLRGLAQAKAEATENTESLEVDRNPVDQDSGAEALVQRRIQAAAARNRALTDADHAEFDLRVKREAVKPPALRTLVARDRLRNAMVWREILGPPLALRDYLDS